MFRLLMMLSVAFASSIGCIKATKLVDRMLVWGSSAHYIIHGLLMRQVDEARALFNKVPPPNVVLVNTLIDWYVSLMSFRFNILIVDFTRMLFDFSLWIG